MGLPHRGLCVDISESYMEHSSSVFSLPLPRQLVISLGRELGLISASSSVQQGRERDGLGRFLFWGKKRERGRAGQAAGPRNCRGNYFTLIQARSGCPRQVYGIRSLVRACYESFLVCFPLRIHFHILYTLLKHCLQGRIKAVWSPFRNNSL